jgi:hypothetical protein
MIFINEVFIAANYLSNGFNVTMPDLSESGGVNIYAEKQGIKIWCECKRLRKDELYTEMAIRILQWLHEKRVNVLIVIDITLAKTPREEPDVIVEAIEKYIERGQLEKVCSLERVVVSRLPNFNDAPLDIRNLKTIKRK